MRKREGKKRENRGRQKEGKCGRWRIKNRRETERQRDRNR